MWERGINAKLVSCGLQAEAVEELHERSKELGKVEPAELFGVEVDHDAEQLTHQADD